MIGKQIIEGTLEDYEYFWLIGEISMTNLLRQFDGKHVRITIEEIESPAKQEGA